MEQKHLDQLVETLGIHDNRSLAKLVHNMRRMRDYVCQKNIVTKFEFGDIVLDTKNKELGFVIGPFEIYGNIDGVQSGQKQRLYLVATFSRTDSKYRVRYVPDNFLESINLEPKESELRKNDLEMFCSNQCIMDCSSECLLWKYKKKR